jgi:hypothetical protein
MICEEIKISLHDYIDQQLNDQMKREIAFHLRTCENCLAEYKRLMQFFLYLKELPVVLEPPKDIIEGVRSELLRQSTIQYEEMHPEKDQNKKKIQKARDKQENLQLERKNALKNNLSRKYTYQRSPFITSSKELKKLLLTILPLLLVAIGYFIYDLQKNNYPWDIKNISGVLLINGNNITGNVLNQGEILATEDSSSATVLIPKVGALELGSSSVVQLTKAKDGANQVRINRGIISIINSNEMPELIVESGNLNIIDRGGEFTVYANDYNDAIIFVKYGFVEIEFNGETFYVDENYSCRIKSGFRPGIPFHKNASDTLKAAIEEFDYKNGGENSVEKIISAAKEYDVLTLLALIPQVKQLQRQIIFQEISNRFPPPENVTRAGILRLEKEMLYRWWVEIEWQL